MSKVQLRLVGAPEDVEAAARVLRRHFRILQEGRDRRQPGESEVRRYVEVFPPDEPVDPKPAERS